MENHNLYETACEIYPGTYVPLLKEEEVRLALKHSHEAEPVHPAVNVSELPDTFLVEMAIPGVKRENILVHSEGNVLFVYVLHKKPGCNEKGFQLHEFNYDCIDRHIILPGNADTELANAEYKEGILCVYIPKTALPGNYVKTEIAVY